MARTVSPGYVVAADIQVMPNQEKKTASLAELNGHLVKKLQLQFSRVNEENQYERKL